MDILGGASTFIANLLGGGKGGGRFNPGTSYMGDFDTDSFIQSNLSGGKPGAGKAILQGVTQLIGGHKPVENSLAAPMPDADLSLTPSAMESGPITPDLKPAGGQLSYLEEVLKGLGQ